MEIASHCLSAFRSVHKQVHQSTEAVSEDNAADIRAVAGRSRKERRFGREEYPVRYRANEETEKRASTELSNVNSKKQKDHSHSLHIIQY